MLTNGLDAANQQLFHGGELIAMAPSGFIGINGVPTGLECLFAQSRTFSKSRHTCLVLKSGHGLARCSIHCETVSVQYY